VESVGPSVGNVKESDVKSRHLQGCSPHLCWLRIDGLTPRVSIERTDRMPVFMGSVSRSSYVTTRLKPPSPYSKAVAREEQ
jgi:hypothetical protein